MANAQPITIWHGMGSRSAGTFTRYPEDASETFKKGTPVFLDSDGMVNPVTTSFGGTEIVLGISAERGSNLTTQNTAQGTSIGTPANQSSGIIEPMGSPMKDGKCAVIHADGQTVFRIASSASVTVTVAMVKPGTLYELALEASGYWTVDTADTGTGADHVLQIVGIDPNDTDFALCVFDISKRVFE